ncbi:kinase-like domain-containing protein [Amanita rubescens]|nr:kinase-like domain-containing protein [Amanita rubescens]
MSALLASSTPIAQGAEAKVYKGYLTADGPPVLLKHRFHKQYRHPTLDATLTKSRVAGEARALLKCLRAGVRVPGIRMVDAAEGILGLEWIDGQSVRRLIPEEGEDTLGEYGVTVDEVMEMIGRELARMHKVDIVHGDLTTSNMMLRRVSGTGAPELVLIDFGLAFQSTLVEDKAVDLYVLERAFGSTHPESEPLFARVLRGYGEEMGREWVGISRRLEEVRVRGRKRSMVG